MLIKLFCLLLLIIAGCSSGDDYPKNSKKNATSKNSYSVTFFDSLGNKLCEGTMSFNQYDTALVSGNVKISKRYYNTFKGSDIIEGKFGGSIIRETTQLVLPPKPADYNLYVNLRRNTDGFQGNWTFTTKKGNENRGTVVCKKI